MRNRRHVQYGCRGSSRRPTIHRMCQTIIHRGPDDEGIYVKGGVGLGMRRLSIIDVSGGQQPIHNEDKTVWVVFNGEIYNFRELRAELERGGHRFYTNTDTEVIVHLYEEFGSNCVQSSGECSPSQFLMSADITCCSHVIAWEKALALRFCRWKAVVWLGDQGHPCCCARTGRG